jgi:dGTPase
MDIEKNGAGLNLSLQVLDGILSHNGEILGRRYCPDYRKNSETFLRQYKVALSDSRRARRIVPMTMEGCVARICDIIAYIGRDIEDAITLKLITRDSLPSPARRLLGDSNDQIINTLVSDMIVNSYSKPYLEFSPEVFKALQGLRAFNYAKIYLNPAIKTQEHKVEDMFKRLYEKYLGDIRRRDKASFVYRYWLRMNARYRRVTLPGRAVVDFIAGMTDDFFNNQFVTLFVPQSFGYVYKKGDR